MHITQSSIIQPQTAPSERRMAVLLGMLAAFAPLAIDLYLPALPAMGASLAAPPGVVQLSVTIFLAGFMLGMLFCGPLSDRIGRSKVLLAGIVMFALASLTCALAGSIEQLIGARFVQALGGGAAAVLARAVVRDLFPGPRAIGLLSMIAMVSAIAPLVAPLSGSVLMAAFGWRGIFAALVAWGAAGLIVVWHMLPESLPREQRVNVPFIRVFGVYGRVLADPAAFGLLLAGGMSYAAMFAYITAGPFFFIRLHGYTPTGYSLVFASNAFGIFAMNYLNRRLSGLHGPAAMMRLGGLLALGGSLALLAAVLTDAPVALAQAGLFVVVATTALLNANGMGLLMERYPQDAGAAAALSGAAQFGCGALASVIVSLLHDGSGQPMAWVMAVASIVSLLGLTVFRTRTRPRS